MKTCRYGGLDVGPSILKVSTRQRRVPSLTLQPLLPCIIFIGGWVGPRACPAAMASDTISVLSPPIRAHDV
jgi:hypothetical protein